MKGKKTGGRLKGSLNKITYPIKEAITDFTSENFYEFTQAWHNLDDKDKVTTFNSILRFVIPIAREEEAVNETTTNIDDLFNRLFNNKS